MSTTKRIQRALISVFYKDGLDKVAPMLHNAGIEIFSTGGTQAYLEQLGIPVVAVEDLTSYPSILGGRVKTLHPKVFGGILGRREDSGDVAQLEQYEIPEFDLVMVDLYPFEETLASGADENEIIEKIDIGGVSLIRAAAKNYSDVLVVSHKSQYVRLAELIKNDAKSEISDRKSFASEAFEISAKYDSAISDWFSGNKKALRYGENPHQKAYFQGNLNEVFEQLHGKELSYNNLLDVDAAIKLVEDFPSSGCAIIKHNNACGAALDTNQTEAWKKALAGDPVSAFGGIFIFNTPLKLETAEECNKLFFEVIIAPVFEDGVLEILKSKKNRIILKTKNLNFDSVSYRTVLNGMLVQDADTKVEKSQDFNLVSQIKPTERMLSDMEFASVLVKHTKSNAVVLVKDKQLLASGTGQTSRIDALKQAIEKAGRMNLEVKDSVLASDAFFPFSDSIEESAEAGISAIIQPGGSVRDSEVIKAVDKLNLAMAFTGIRHFKH